MHCRRLQHPKLCARSMRLMHSMSLRQTQVLNTRTVAGKEWQRHAWCTAVAAIINCSGLFSTSNLEGVARFNTCTIRPGKLLVHKKVKLQSSMATAQQRHPLIRVAHQSTLLMMQVLSSYQDFHKHLHSKLEMRQPPLSVETCAVIALSTKRRTPPRFGTTQLLKISILRVAARSVQRMLSRVAHVCRLCQWEENTGATP